MPKHYRSLLTTSLEKKAFQFIREFLNDAQAVIEIIEIEQMHPLSPKFIYDAEVLALKQEAQKEFWASLLGKILKEHQGWSEMTTQTSSHS